MTRVVSVGTIRPSDLAAGKIMKRGTSPREISGASKGAATFDCVIVGDVMMDVILRCESEIVDSLIMDGTNYFSESKITPGGSGNVAVAIAKLGGRVAFVGKAGNDPYGRAYSDDLTSARVATRITVDPRMSTGLAVCLVEPSGSRTMLVSRGANDYLTKNEVTNALKKMGRPRFIYLPGYSLNASPQREAILHAARLGHEQQSRVVFDPGASNLVREHPDVFQEAVDRSDILCANLDEARVLAGKVEVNRYAARLSRKGKLVVVKTGVEGCLLASDGEITRIPGVRTRAVDTTGAGDAFLGAFLYSMSRDVGPVTSARFANWFASRTTEKLGPRNYPGRNEARHSLLSLQRKTMPS